MEISGEVVDWYRVLVRFQSKSYLRRIPVITTSHVFWLCLSAGRSTHQSARCRLQASPSPPKRATDGLYPLARRFLRSRGPSLQLLGRRSDLLDRVVPLVENQGFRVLRYDQPGHGRSGAPTEAELTSVTFETLADDVYHLLGHLKINKLHAWVGVSMGGIKAVYFTARHPGIVNKIVVADAIAASPAVACIPDNFAARVSAVKQSGSISEDLSNTRKRWFGEDWMAKHPEETARMEKSMATTTIQGLEACCAALSSPSFDLRPLYTKVGHGCEEALIVAGEKDADLPVKMQEMRQAIEESLRSCGKKVPLRMEIIKGAGHVPYIDGFEDFCEIITKFLPR